MKAQISVMVASQQAKPFPGERIYLPVQVGAVLAEPVPGMQPDSQGPHISEKNPNYCELTAVYWAWKNLDADYIGLNHYRRYFAGKRFGRRRNWIATGSDLEEALQKAPVILPKKRNYFIETNYSQYVHAHHREDLDTTRQILQEKYPEYVPAFDAVMKRTSGHRFNMFVMRRDYFETYCAWLFSVLFDLEERLDISGYSAYDRRVFGFVAERLMDVWIETEQVPYTELPVAFTEKQNWLKKGSAFLLRKFRGGRVN